MRTFDLESKGLRALNQALHDQAKKETDFKWEIINRGVTMQSLSALMHQLKLTLKVPPVITVPV